jgi:hypothetical protein
MNPDEVEVTSLTRQQTIRLESMRILAEHADKWSLRSLAEDTLFLAEMVETGVVPTEKTELAS